jgi:predicted transcriptional regulator with HTH domain
MCSKELEENPLVRYIEKGSRTPTWGARLVHLGLLGICKKADFKDYHIFTEELKQEVDRRSRFDKKILQHLYEIESEFFEKAICDPQP